MIVQTEGSRQVSRRIDHYALPAIIALGYRVKSAVGTRFRQWATERLQEFVVKGFTMDDWVERLDLFLRFNEREVLPDAGRVSAALAELRAAEEYDRFQSSQRAIEASEPVSDFDRVVEAARRVEKNSGE